MLETEQKGIELFPGGVLNFQQIKAGTNSFDPKNKIGQGGFGDVYKVRYMHQNDLN
mgnify:CR=1